MAEPITFIVPGQADASAVGRRAGAAFGTAATRSGGEDVAPGIAKSSVQLGALRGAGTEPPRLIVVPGEDVVARRIAGGPVPMPHPATARGPMLAQNPPPGLRGDSGRVPDEVAVTPQLRWRGLLAARQGRSE